MELCLYFAAKHDGPRGIASKVVLLYTIKRLESRELESRPSAFSDQLLESPPQAELFEKIELVSTPQIKERPAKLAFCGLTADS